MAKLLLLDGNSLTYRAFFALPTDMATASGQVTNAVFGFTSMLINLLRDQKPDGVVVLFDRPEPTFRHDAVPEYKAQREAAPDILRQQMGLVRQVVNALNIEVADLEGYEADDLIATLATRGRDLDIDVVIVTGDRDTYQLVEDPHVGVLYNRRGVSDYVLYDEAGIKEKTGVTPAEYTEYAALRGDPSDNLAGVPGVGEKTAAKLIVTYGGLDGIFANVDKQTPKLRESLAAERGAGAQERRGHGAATGRAHRPRSDEHRRTRREARPRRGEAVVRVPRVPVALRPARRGARRAHRRDPPVPRGRSRAEVIELDAAGAVAALTDLKGGDDPVSIGPCWVGVAGRSDLVGLAFATGDEAAVWVPSAVLAHDDVRASLAQLLSDDRPGVHVHQAKALMRSLYEIGLDLRSLELDTSIAAYLLDPAESRYAISDLLARYAGLELGAHQSDELQLDLDGSSVDDSMVAALDAVAAPGSRLRSRTHSSIRGCGCCTTTIENPLVRVLARMERRRRGRRRRRAARTQRSARRASAGASRRRSRRTAGIEFNVNSTHQLREVLFDKLGLAPQKKTKTGFSTDAASLEKLRGQHPIIELLLRYREVEKLRVDLRRRAAGRGRAPTDASTPRSTRRVARTGRLSSDAPNLHNIPVRSERAGSSARRSCRPRGSSCSSPTTTRSSCACIAHLAEDPGLIEAFDAGQDIHTATAARVFGVEPDTVTSSSGRRRRWCRTAWPTAWRPTGSDSGSTSRPTRRRRSSTRTSWRSRR